MPDFAWLTEQQDVAWRYLHGVGPEPHHIAAPEPPRYCVPGTRTPIGIIPDEDLVTDASTARNGLDSWDF